MDFRGHLRLPEDAGTGIPVLLRLDDIFVVISSGDDELGSWRADDVAIERIFSNQFAIVLDGESMVFDAQDALGFAYDGISAIEDLQERLTKRRVFKRSKKPKQVETASDIEPVKASQQPVPAAREVVLDVDAPAAQSVEEPATEPADEPVLAGEPQAIWTPPSATQPPAPPRVTTEPDFELAVPEPVQRRDEAEAAVPPVADVRVSYPQPSPPPALAEESSAPPVTTTPEADPAEALPASHESLEIPPPSSEPQLIPEPASADEAPVTVEPTPVPVEEPQTGPVTEAPEFEIEEVSAASTGGTWADDAMVEIEPDEPEIEIEIEEYVLPAAGAADMFTPAPNDEVETASQESSQQLQAAEPNVSGSDSTPPLEVATGDAVPPVEGKHLADDTAVGAEMPTAEDPAADAPVEAVASNGHSRTPKTDVSQETNKRERRHSLFGRSRDKKAPPHEHQYGEPKTIGGLKRQVCEVCAHVTFSGEDVYQGW